MKTITNADGVISAGSTRRKTIGPWRRPSGCTLGKMLFYPSSTKSNGLRPNTSSNPRRRNETAAFSKTTYRTGFPNSPRGPNSKKWIQNGQNWPGILDEPDMIRHDFACKKCEKDLHGMGRRGPPFALIAVRNESLRCF